MPDPVYVVATIAIKPGTDARLLAGYEILRAATLKEAGCLSYELHKALNTPDTYVFVERWESRSHLEAHFGQPHIADWRKVGAELVTSRQIEIIHPAKVETL